MLHPQYDDEGSNSLLSDHESSPAQDHSDAESELWTGRTHTIPFKVIGCTKETRYQDVLRRASSLRNAGVAIPVELRIEPGNPVDPNAIAFMCSVDGCFERVGYVVKEARDAVHDALTRNDITLIKLKWVKYVTDWYRMGPGFFAAVNITKKGVWPTNVVMVKSTR